MVNTHDSERGALLFVDYQVALCEEGEHTRLPALAAAVTEGGVIGHAARALSAARAAGEYVVHVRLGFDPTYEARTNRTARWDAYPTERAMLADSPGAQIVAPLAPLATEPVVIKGSVDPFIGTPVMAMLHGHGIHRVAIAGVATNLAVESAVRHAGDSGLTVVVLEDACASFSPAAHDFSFTTIMPMFAMVISTDDYVASLESA